MRLLPRARFYQVRSVTLGLLQQKDLCEYPKCFPQRKGEGTCIFSSFDSLNRQYGLTRFPERANLSLWVRSPAASTREGAAAPRRCAESGAALCPYRRIPRQRNAEPPGPSGQRPLPSPRLPFRHWGFPRCGCSYRERGRAAGQTGRDTRDSGKIKDPPTLRAP